MARRRRRSYRGITSVSLGRLPIVNNTVKGTDVLVGAAVGPLVGALLSGLEKKFAGGAISSKLPKEVPASALFGVATAAALYYGQKKSSMGAGHAIGALAVSLAPIVTGFVRPMLEKSAGEFFNFSDVVSVQLSGVGNYRGLLVSDNSDRFNGLLVQDNSDRALAGLAAMSMGDHDDDGMSALMGG